MVFVESVDIVSTRERHKAVQLVKRLTLIGKRYGRHRIEIAPKADVEAHISSIENCQAWVECEACDDPHIFALVRVKSVKFILTDEKRMEKCRKRMNARLDRKYLSFKVVNSESSFDSHKSKICS